MKADNRGKHFLLWLMRGHEGSAQELDKIQLVGTDDTDTKDINWKMRDSGVSNQYLRNSNELKFDVSGGEAYEQVKIFSFDQPTNNYILIDIDAITPNWDGEITIPEEEIDIFIKDVEEL